MNSCLPAATETKPSCATTDVTNLALNKLRIYSINRPGRLLNFWTLRVGAYSRWALI